MNQVLEVGQKPAFSSQAQREELPTLCPVRALHAYVTCTQPPVKSHSQLFVCYGKAKLGLPFSKQRLSHWFADVISHSYNRSSSSYRDTSPLNQKCSYFIGCIEGSSFGRHLCCSIMVYIMYVCKI